MFRAKIVVVLLLMGLFGWYGARASQGSSSSPSQAAPAPEDWQKEFDDICSRTDNAMTVSQEELTELIRRCDALLPQMAKLDESRKKIYTERLRKCRGLYAYVLDAKRNEKK